ncbi:MAG: phosphatidylglycerophosphatase A [Bacteroidetes bacterium]|nr:MAG: phosphatidylglycerophosphatase A [Bacteroidota bacterium]
MIKLHKIIASGLGFGFSPIAPGTAGSILGIGLLYAVNYLLNYLGYQELTIIFINLFAIILMTFIGVYSIKVVHRTWKHDASEIVIDEIVGVWIAVFALPFQWQFYLAAFVLFRLFDIYKPLFIRKIDKMDGNWSVMIDDVLAGVYANLILQLVVFSKIF